MRTVLMAERQQTLHWEVGWVKVTHRLLLALAAVAVVSPVSGKATNGKESAAEAPSGLSHFATESEAQRHFKSRAAEQKHLDRDVEVAILRGWWSLAEDIIRQSHISGVDVAATVHSNVLEVKKSADELIRILDKNHNKIQRVSPAFQWAQSDDSIFLSIKYAYRWTSPGSLMVENENITTSDCCFFFSGIGTKSHASKLYELNLELYDALQPNATVWSFASVGKLSVTLKKQIPAMWQRLTKSTDKISNMHIWWDMRDRIERRNEPEVDEVEKEEKKKGEKKKKAKQNTEESDESTESSNESDEDEGDGKSQQKEKGVETKKGAKTKGSGEETRESESSSGGGKKKLEEQKEGKKTEL